MPQNKILVYLRRTVLRVAHESRTVTEEITDAIGTVIDNIVRSLSADRTPTDIFTATDNLDYTQVIATLSGSFFVDTNHGSASDSNPGTEALPWKTIYKAAQTLTAGQTCYVKNGTYNESINCSWTTPACNPANSGTAGNPITFSAYPGHMPYVTNSVTGTSCPVIGAKDRSYIVWSGFEVYAPGSKGAILNSSDHITITKCKIHGQRATGGDNTECVRIDNCDDCTISDNLMYDVDDGDVPIGCGAGGVKMYGSNRIIMEYNEVYDVGCGLRNKATGSANIFRYNWIYDCTQDGIAVDALKSSPTSDHEVYGNIVARCEHGIAPQGSNNNHDGTTIYNNTCVDMSRQGIHISGTNVTGVTTWNNIIYDAGASELDGSNPPFTYCDYHCFWLTAAGCGSNSITANPQFVDTAFTDPLDFKLQGGSPCTGTGRYGDNIGAYITGSETVGRSWS